MLTSLAFPPAWSQWLKSCHQSREPSREEFVEDVPYWCVFMMAVRLIVPSLMAFFSTGATLAINWCQGLCRYHVYERDMILLGRIGRVNDHSILRFVIDN